MVVAVACARCVAAPAHSLATFVAGCTSSPPSSIRRCCAASVSHEWMNELVTHFCVCSSQLLLSLVFSLISLKNSCTKRGFPTSQDLGWGLSVQGLGFCWRFGVWSFFHCSGVISVIFYIRCMRLKLICAVLQVCRSGCRFCWGVSGLASTSGASPSLISILFYSILFRQLLRFMRRLLDSKGLHWWLSAYTQLWTCECGSIWWEWYWRRRFWCFRGLAAPIFSQRFALPVVLFAVESFCCCLCATVVTFWRFLCRLQKSLNMGKLVAGKLLWNGAEGWVAALKLLAIAEAANVQDLNTTGPIAWRRFVLSAFSQGFQQSYHFFSLVLLLPVIFPS